MIHTATVLLVFALAGFARQASVSGVVDDPQGRAVASATVSIAGAEGTSAATTSTSADGKFQLAAGPGRHQLRAHSAGFQDIIEWIDVPGDGLSGVILSFHDLASQNDSVTVTAAVNDGSVDYPDPSTKVYVREQILDANPGRPGAPVSIPGYPIETASSGIKAPQYFGPGVAGDHGEPIATFFQLGSFLIPNNLSANAHGNGYSDPNVLIPQTVESVQVDGGAFNAREGNHSVNASEVYGLHDRIDPHVTLTGDYRDLDLSAGWSPENSGVREFFAVQTSYGNGFLNRLEHRQQYNFNAFRGWQIGRHELSVLLMGYYGFSYIPGLVPVGAANAYDTIDSRQRDQTHTGEFAINDVWLASPEAQLQSSAFFRSYNLSLYSNFGEGLIRQSEFRTVAGGNENYIRHLTRTLTLLAGADVLRDAPRRDDLDRYAAPAGSGPYGPFQKITANDITLGFLSPYLALDGRPLRWLHFNLAWRRDEVHVENRDLLRADNSFDRWTGVNNPKATVSLIAPERTILPSASFSFGQSYFTNDPRIGTGDAQGTLVSRAHSFQAVVWKDIAGFDFRVTLGRVTQEQSLAKIDADTGLQFDEGPSRNRYTTIAARRAFRWGLVQASVSKADARDLSNGTPVPEAPRLIADALAAVEHLPFGLRARAEFEEVGAKPLGDGFIGVPVREFRGAIARSFRDGRIEVGIHFLAASGYTGQTTEVVALASDADAVERVVGVRLPSYVTASFTYRLGK